MIAPGDFPRAAAWLTRGPLAQLLPVLDRDGEEARVIGGAVRNTLLGEPAGDIDVATTAVPEEIIRRSENAGFRAVPTGIEHGTVTVIIDGQPIEVTTLREDVQTFGRKASVRFGRDWRADAERRDFTMNALSVTRAGEVIDLVGGLADLAARRVRFIGDPDARIREDYLRILRFFRFHARYGLGAPDARGLAAAIRQRHGLDQLSRERVRMELLKLLAAPQAAPMLAVMAESGLIEPILGVPRPPQLGRLIAVEQALGLAPDPVLRLGVLAMHVTDDADRLTERLRLANAEHGRLAAMADRWRDVRADMTAHKARALLYRVGSAHYRDRILFAWSHSGASSFDSAWRHLATLPDRWQPPRFPLRAADFIERGVPKGRALGAALAEAEDAWIAADFPEAPDALEKIAEAAVAKQRA